MSAESESGLNVFGKVKLTFSDIYDRQDAIMKKINLKAQTANLNYLTNMDPRIVKTLCKQVFHNSTNHENLANASFSLRFIMLPHSLS